MAVKLRLKKMGAKQRPFYRIVATDSRVSRDGKFIEIVGTYNPLTDPAEIKLDKDLVLKWLNYGAEVTDTVRNILKKEGVYKEFIDSKAKKSNKKPVAKKAETKPVEKKEEKKPVVKKATAKKPVAKTTTKKAATKPAAKKSTTKKEA